MLYIISAVMSRRRSTVHDAAALRLHPSGVRVNDLVQNAARSVVTVKTKNPTVSRQLPRGNWIATDAGGDGRVTKRRKVDEDKITGMEAGKSSIGDGQDRPEVARSEEQLADMPVKVYKDMRANRRVAFENDLTFLAAPASVPNGNTSRLQPSSVRLASRSNDYILTIGQDFLKCIHYFASQYYGSRGELFDSAGDYRKMKKENRRQRMLEVGASGSQDPKTSQDGNEDQEAESDDPSKVVFPTSESTRVRKEKGISKSGNIKEKRRDMYKAFDGSALLCIGRLSSMCTNLTISNLLKQGPYFSCTLLRC